MTHSPKFYRCALRWLPAFLIGAMWLAFFWPMLCGSAVAGYRDSSYLYYPMFQWVDWQMQQGNFPLWMPYENTGFPLLADGTSSLIYPGKAVFLLRWMSFPARYGWYLALHVLLAAAGSYWMAKTLGANRWGATLAAISYAFGGSVLFQVCNVIYLVSAAWLPWALTAVWNMSGPSGTTKATLAAAVCCSMMILGGDPQMVYHVGLIAVATTTISLLKHSSDTRASTVSRLSHLMLLVVATSVLSAVQLLPTMEWAQYSDRAKSDVPMNIYHGDFESLVNLPDRPPVSDVYQFSQEPWSMLGLVFPNVFGLDAPVNSRWSAALPGAERVWTPSNYFGCVVFLLAISGFAFTSGKQQGQGRAVRVWLTWIAVWFCLASFGWYGVNWLLTEIGWATGAAEPGTFRQPIGGLYWLMVVLLPKYCLFRYPAKLMVVGCLALCVLAGVRLKPNGLGRVLRLSSITMVVGLIGIAILFLPRTIEFLKSCHTATLFGPFQFDQCWNTVLFSIISTITVCGLLLCAAITRRAGESSYRSVYLGLIVLLMVELGVNNRWMLHPIDVGVMTKASSIQSEINNQRGPKTKVPFTVSVIQTDFHNRRFYTESSENRVAELATWRREMLFPKMHLLVGDVRLWGGFTSIWPTAFDQINYQIVDADASLQNIEDSARLKLDRSSDQMSADPLPMPQTNWQGQTLKFRFAQRTAPPQPLEILLPLFPVPGWTAELSSNENDQQVRIPLVPAGELYSRLPVPDEFASATCDVRCVYSPSSFLWGGLISIAGWLSLLTWGGVKLRSLKRSLGIRRPVGNAR